MLDKKIKTSPHQSIIPVDMYVQQINIYGGLLKLSFLRSYVMEYEHDTRTWPGLYFFCSLPQIILKNIIMCKELFHKIVNETLFNILKGIIIRSKAESVGVSIKKFTNVGISSDMYSRNS